MYDTLERRVKQVWRKTEVGPNSTERRILDTIERSGGLLVSYRAGVLAIVLADGTPISRLGSFDLALAVELGWLCPVPLSPSLLPGMPAQRYLVAEHYSVGEG